MFRDPGLIDFVTSLASVDSMTVLAGAGTSIESGFPGWTQLLQNMLADAAIRDGLSEDDARSFATWTVQSEGLTAAAAVAELALEADFEAAIHRALYPVQLTPRSAESASAIVQLAESFGRTRCDIATTNYDLLLEQAHEDAGFMRPSVHTTERGRSLNRVLHLHGVVGPRGRVSGELILSERDYFAMQDDSAWQQRYFSQRLQESTCLFVGASLSDPNLLRYLYRTDTDRVHWAIFARQQDALAYNDTEPEVVAYRERTAVARWKAAGVSPVQVDYFSQSAQLLYEALHFRSCKRRRRMYKPLNKRLHRWRSQLDKSVTSTKPAVFSKNQDMLHTIASQLIDAVTSDLRDAGKRPSPTERLSLSLWVYEPSNETLTNWAFSDRVWRDSTTLEPTPIGWTSEFVSVQAFCTGSIVSWSTEQYAATRWNHVVGAPLYLHADEWGRLPVGAVTIGSTASAADSSLQRGLAILRRKSLPEVCRVLSDLLHPTSVVPAPL